MASRMLSDAGYNHYEISSYCKTGFECKHNLTYWKNKPFYGFGLGSASYVGGLRFSRPKKMKQYVGYVEDLENGLINGNDNTHTAAKDIATDVVMLSLRTARGLDLKYFGDTFGDSLVFSLCETYRPYVESGHIIFLDEQGRSITADELNAPLLHQEDQIKKAPAFIRLSDPDGFLLSNELISLAFGVIEP